MTPPDAAPRPDTNLELPPGWNWVRLAEMCDTNTKTRDPRLEPDTSFHYVDITSIDNLRKRITSIQTLLGRDAPSRARQVIRAGDVIVSTTRPNLNAVAIVPPDLDDQICSTGFCVLRPGSRLDRDYLFAFVQSEEFVENLSGLVRGALYPAVTDRQVRVQFIPLPSLSEQMRIAAILNEQVVVVERARAAAEAQLQTAKALPAACLRAVFNSPEAQQWPMTRVSQICDSIDYGFTASADYEVREPRFLRITDIQDGSVDWEKVPGCRINSDEESRYRLMDGDIVFARTGATTGKSYLMRHPPRAVFASYLIRIRPSPAVTAEYLYAFFQSDRYWQQIRAAMRGGAQPNVNATLLGALALALPSLSEQRQIAPGLSEEMAVAEALRKRAEEQLHAINALPAALLRRAFSGEL